MEGSLSSNFISSLSGGFEKECYEVLISGYSKMLKEDFNIDWHETDITNQFVLCMRSLPIANRYQISIIPEYPLIKPVRETGQAKTNPRIDIIMSSWVAYNCKHFNIEAKNINELNWSKSSGTLVDANQQCKAYVRDGIKRVIDRKYHLDCMVGYVLNGDPDNIVLKINRHISNEDVIGKITNKKSIFEYPYCYSSNNLIESQKFRLVHIFFILYKNSGQS